MISSKLSANASRPPANRAERSSGNVTYRKVWKVVAPRSAEASSKLVAGAPQPRQHVVVDDHDAERRVADDDREQALLQAERLRDVLERGRQRHAGDDAGQRDRQHDQQRQRVPAEEPVATDRERDHRAEHQRDRGRAQTGLDRRPQGLARARVVPRLRPPGQRSGRGGGQAKVRSALNEFTTHHGERHVDERQADRHRAAQQPLAERVTSVTAPPARRCGGRRSDRSP